MFGSTRAVTFDRDALCQSEHAETTELTTEIGDVQDSDNSDVLDSDNGETGGKARSRAWVRWGSAGIGLLLIAGCLAVALGSGRSATQDARPLGQINGRQLFASEDLIEAATDTTMKTGTRAGVLKEIDRPHVRSQVAAGFQQYGRRLAGLSPEVASRLDSWSISPQQHRTLEAMFQNIGDPRVQHIGAKVGRAMQASRAASENQEQTKARILEALKPDLPEIRQLRDELVAKSERRSAGKLRQLLLSGHEQELGLKQARRLQVFLTTESPNSMQLPALSEMPNVMEIKEAGQAALESAQVMLSSALMMVQVSGMQEKLPDIAMNFLQAGNYFIQFASCLLNNLPSPTTARPTFYPNQPTAQPAPGNQMALMMGMMACPMQLGAQGQQSIGLLLSELGIPGEPFFPFTEGISIFENDDAMTTASP